MLPPGPSGPPDPPTASDLLIATPDLADARIDEALQDLLRLIRSELQMDVAFVAEFVEGRRVFRHVDATDGPIGDLVQPGDSHPLNESLCQRVVDGSVPMIMSDVQALRLQLALPVAIGAMGAHAGVPVRLKDGSIYGTLCCFSMAPDSRLDALKLKRLEMSASIVARLLDAASGNPTG